MGKIIKGTRIFILKKLKADFFMGQIISQQAEGAQL